MILNSCPDLSPQNPESDRKILIVDDDLGYIKVLKESLEEAGYTVYLGFDGAMALEQVDDHEPDLILLDIYMPYRDGLVTFETLRQKAKTRWIPVIFVTEVASDVLQPVLESGDRVAHLKKPADLDDVLSLVRVFLNQYPRTPCEAA